ncbi:hypothetical protein OJ997_27410 [Solirubrobacter phytolaccae]|uniref:Uncharacterized protein n=1 Tax=Solirubrobacter phytolaccae TaxID=1404360 RepID=A0A9X3SI95_9ACTN|nr:hypothetical protein [Solirubrobacter phytolaccae]MDA0184067.1 hypothetical protein [Solirubrobacter phytolaccae]
MLAQRRSERRVAVASLVVLSAVGAELLAAYNDTTGRPLALLGNLIFFALLYGCPALLIRELTRRTGRGWTTMLLLSAAAGLTQAGLLDQSLFAERYDDVRGWEESYRATAIEPLGVSAYMLQNFLLGHIVYSFCAPIALVEAMCPSVARRPWLGRAGIVVATGLWLLVAGAIFADAGYATLPELAVTLTVVVALIAAALRFGGRASRTSMGAGTPRAGTVLAVSFVAATAHALMPDDWVGTAGAFLIATAAAAGLIRAARGSAWGLPHCAALATGVLLSRGALAFTYYPVVGHTSAAAKYGHNVVMLGLVVAAGVYAARRSAG